MLKKLNNFFEKNLVFIILLSFPVCVLLRSAMINLFFITCSLFLVFKRENYKKTKLEIWMILFFIFIFYTSNISFFALDFFSSFKSSISQLRFIFFIILLSLMSENENTIKKFTSMMLILVSFVCLDVIYQYFSGYDIFGIHAGDRDPLTDPDRLSGPFGEELIVGSYIYLISIPIISNLFYNFYEKTLFDKSICIFFSALVFFTILLSGERMAFILFLASLLAIILINFSKKDIAKFFFTIFVLIILMFNLNSSVNNRLSNFYGEIKNFKNANHFRLFSSAISIWSENKLFGVGLKNFRVVCDEKNYNKITKENYLCSTHPHNFYLELLVETGIIGFLIFLLFLIGLLRYIYQKSFLINDHFKGLFIGSALVVLMYVWPIKSSGSIFTTFYASFFWFNIGIICLTSKKKN